MAGRSELQKKKPSSTSSATDPTQHSQVKEEVSHSSAEPEVEHSVPVLEVINDNHLKRWANLFCEMFLVGVDLKEPINTSIGLPQIVATLALLGHIAPLPVRSAILQALHVHGQGVLRIVNNQIPLYLRNWERELSRCSRPGSYTSSRRVLIHTSNSKSYCLTTFLALKHLGVELKLASKSHDNEILEWLRKRLKIGEVSDCHMPFHLWQDDFKCDQTDRNKRCPILAFATHFQFQVRTTSLDINTLYIMKFRFADDEVDDVLACKISPGHQNGVRYVDIDECKLIELPVVTEELKVYVISAAEKCDIKTGDALIAAVGKFKSEENVNKLDRLYLPIFDGALGKAVNIADILVRAIRKYILIHKRKSADVEKAFQCDGFGDLSCEGGEPSSSLNQRLVPSIQHYERLELMYIPKFTPELVLDLCSFHINISSPHIRPREENELLLDCPFTIVVFDHQRNVPIYLTRVVAPERRRNAEHQDRVSVREPRGHEEKESLYSRIFTKFKGRKEDRPTSSTKS